MDITRKVSKKEQYIRSNFTKRLSDLTGNLEYINSILKQSMYNGKIDSDTLAKCAEHNFRLASIEILELGIDIVDFLESLKNN